MNSFLHYKYWALMATLFWLMASWTGVHGHYCFDGQEPPVSIHLDNVDAHEDHGTNSAHVDLDVDLSQSVVAKLLKYDATLPLLLLAAFVFLIVQQAPFTHAFSPTHHPRRLVGLRPPLRAPPAIPV